eukprot:TRINITY_DN50112_c0_g1_i1.p1 TRINITY_DN50112_c0_g1~~TRINITY_DN50112_c0_g1_i1.p1  ORF type:complete len:746 (+),score=94.19 TRINITY_DN50112_c0_g1_i1:55-2238(+)
MATLPGSEEGPRLVLVPAESPQRCVLECADDFRSGKVVKLTLSSHPGHAIVPRYADARRAEEWAYIELGIGPISVGVEAQLRDGYIIRPFDQRVFDIAYWKYEVGSALTILKSATAHPSHTFYPGGGRSFQVNANGTISCQSARHLVLGSADNFVGPRLVLVKRTADTRCIFEHAGGLKAGKNVDLTLKSHPGFAIRTKQSEPMHFDEWAVIELGIGPANQSLRASLRGGFISWPEKEMVFDIRMWQYHEGNSVLLVKSNRDHPGRTHLHGGGRTFQLNDDGTISCSSAPHLVLGLSYPVVAAKSKDTEQISSIFKKFDKNQDGYLCAEEIGEVFRRLDGKNFTPERVRAMMSCMDNDGDGRVDYEEFTQWITSDVHTPREVMQQMESYVVCRRRCTYGLSCRRKDPEHKRVFAHPGDVDFEEEEAEKEKESAEIKSGDSPEHWSVHSNVREEHGWQLWNISDPSLLAALAKFLRVHDPKHLGVGRDAKKYDKPYNDLELYGAWRVEHRDLWDLYDGRRKMIGRNVRQLRAAGASENRIQFKTQEASEGLPGGELQPTSNEIFLLHGSRPESVLSIIANGLSERLSSLNGLFGAAIYLAEDSSKIDQYTTPDGKFKAGGLDDLHVRLYQHGIRHPEQDVFYCFVVRACMGWSVRTMNGAASIDGGFNIFAGSDKRELGLVPESSPPSRFHSLVAELGQKLKRFREFMVFENTQTYIEYVIAYKRVNK